jgi:hypothetical protein
MSLGTHASSVLRLEEACDLEQRNRLLIVFHLPINQRS